MNRKEYKSYIESFYRRQKQGWPLHDKWHEHSHNMIYQFVNQKVNQYGRKRKMKILNCGSGGTTYGIDYDMYHLDIIKEKIDMFPHWKVGSADNIPYPDEMFDLVICVGSVIDYCDGKKALENLCRVLKQGGILLLEFENSYSAEYLLEKQFGRDMAMEVSEYFKEKHYYWVYSLPFVARTLHQHGVHIKEIKHIHIVSALLYRIFGSGNIAGRLGWLDKRFQKSHMRGYCGNIIVEAVKK